MVKEYLHSETGVVYAHAASGVISVDELIAFLEKHRGKHFYNDAACEISFRIDGEKVKADSISFILDYDFEDDWNTANAIQEYLCEDGDYPAHDELELIYDYVPNFFDNDSIAAS